MQPRQRGGPTQHAHLLQPRCSDTMTAFTPAASRRGGV